jgi:hypothetical protein
VNGILYTQDSAVVGRLREYFERQCASAKRGRARTPEQCSKLVPSAAQLASILDAAFWASLRNEEGRPVTLSLAFARAAAAKHPFVFATPLPLDAERLAKISPAVERPGIHLGVAEGALGALEVWGYTRQLPLSAMVLEAAGPGLLVVKHRRNGARGKFANVALLTGKEAKFIGEKGDTTLDLADVVEDLLAERGLAGADREATAQVLHLLALSMRAHKRGGTLLVVPAGSDAWRKSLADPLAYRATPHHAELRDKALEEPGRVSRGRGLAKIVDIVGGLTAVDGATVVTDGLEVVGFGAKIRRRDGATPVGIVLTAEPVEDRYPSVSPIWALGGTRHQSAAQFVQDQTNAIALVSSQEGRFTVFVWSDSLDGVVAHRVDTLLY